MSEERKKKIIKQCIIGIIAVIVIAIVITVIYNISVHIERENKRKIEESKVEIPDFVGMTYQEAKEKASNIGLKLTLGSTSSTESDDAIVTYQVDNGPELRVEKGTEITIILSTQEEVEEDERETQIKNDIWRACSAFAETVEALHQGSVIYVSPSSYGGTETSGKVYKLKYKTSNPNHYYYQLVSFNADYTKVVKSTNLFSFYDYGNGETGQTQELEYAYKNTF